MGRRRWHPTPATQRTGPSPSGSSASTCKTENLLEHRYPAPRQEWLAWVQDPEIGTKYALRCLMCRKWVTDLEGTTTDGYVGNHGDVGPENSVEHKKYINNLEWYKKDESWWARVATERKRWHPDASPGVAVVEKKQGLVSLLSAQA